MILPLEKGETVETVARDLTDYVNAGLPAEKKQAEADMIATGQMLQKTGSLATKEGLGQRVASIPARVYHRWDQLYPGCWKDPEFVREFLTDNPQCRAPGYYGKASGLRHGITFSGGAAIYHLNKKTVK